MKRTELTNHYWNENGVYQHEFTTLTDELMPLRGMAKYLVGEVVRAANRLYYEYCNNGNINAIDVEELEPEEYPCPECGGSGYVGEDEDEDAVCGCCDGSGVCYGDTEYEYSINEYYGNFIQLIRSAMESDGNTEGVDAMDAIECFLDAEHLGVTSHSEYFSDRNMHKYDLMVDLVTEYAEKHRNDKTDIPSWYGNA